VSFDLGTSCDARSGAAHSIPIAPLPFTRQCRAIVKQPAGAKKLIRKTTKRTKAKRTKAKGVKAKGVKAKTTHRKARKITRAKKDAKTQVKHASDTRTWSDMDLLVRG
jgi:hypothetical protein